MPPVSSFISPVHSMGPNHSFRQFQDAPKLIQDGLAWGTKEQDAGRVCITSDVMQWIIDHYDVNQKISIGELADRLEKFVTNPVRCRMVRCYVDHNCNMVAAKLAWREDY